MPIVETVASVAATSLTLIGKDAFLSGWFDGCKKRILEERRVPGNRDVVSGIRTAQLCALRHVATVHQAALKGLPAYEIGDDEGPFSASILGYLDKRLRLFRGHNLDTDVLTLDDLDHVFDEVLKPSVQEGFSAPAADPRDRAINRALEEIERDAGRKAPPIFLSFFLGERGSAGWYEAFSLFIAEELKTNDRFRAIFEAGQLVSLKGAAERMASDLRAQHADLMPFMDDVRGQLDRIERKIDAILDVDTVKQALAEAEAELGTTRDLARALFRVILQRDVPDDQLAAAFLETAAAWGASNPATAANRWGNLAPELDALIEESRRAYAANDVERFYAIRSEIADIEEKAYASALEQEREAREARQARQDLLIEALQEKQQAAIASLDGQGAADTIVRQIELQVSEEALFGKLLEVASDWYERGRNDGLSFDLIVAIAIGRQTLTKLARERVPLDWAMTQNNLGNALSILGMRDSEAARLDEAVEAYRAALEEFTRQRAPLHWANTQNNLANALQILGSRESGVTRLEEAVEAYRAALEERTRKRVPLDWATTQSNLANALQVLGDRERGTARLEDAVRAYRAALGEHTRKRAPLDWALTQNNLGRALQALGERESGTARLEDAVEAHRLALEEFVRERVPLDWAMTQNNLGSALSTLGQRESGTARLKDAVRAHRAALEEYARERVPLHWAMTQNNLGSALQKLGERESGTARLEDAVRAYRAALEEHTRQRVPLHWALTQHNLGLALQSLGERESGTARLEEAADTYRAALEERTPERVPLQWEATQMALAAVEKLLEERRSGPE